MTGTPIILNDPPYGTERRYNAPRLANGTRRASLSQLTDWTV
jgi:sulfur relay (sulfurtransferase) complex TusBCD TusD component (DsrE family)